MALRRSHAVAARLTRTAHGHAFADAYARSVARCFCTGSSSSAAYTRTGAPAGEKAGSPTSANTSTQTNNIFEEEPKTHFGYKDVPLRDKQRMVTSLFSSVASNYDVMNDLMSMRVHRLWKDAFVNTMAPAPDLKILDVAAGTADISLRVASRVQAAGGWTSGGLTVTDVNADMLAVAEQRLRASSAPPTAQSASCVVANAEALPFADSLFDVYAISFGMRNVPRPEIAVREAYRVLRPGGRFLMLEFGAVSNPLVSRIYDAWSFNAIPAIGAFVANDAPAYRYLVESIRRFPSQPEFVSLLRDTGFVQPSSTDYTFGVAACYSAFKPVSRIS